MRIHIVQKGDTLWKIAKKYGVNFEELKKLNSQLSNPDMIMPGMKIKIPTTGGSVVKEAPISGKEAKINLGVKKEVPKTELPFVKEQPIMPVEEAPIAETPIEMPVEEAPIAEAPKVEIPKVVAPAVEKPKKPYTPKMPKTVIPEIDINNYYTMNMENLSIQTPPPQKPLKPQLSSEQKPHPQLPPKPKNILPSTDESPESMESSIQFQGGYKQPMYPYQLPYNPAMMPNTAYSPQGGFVQPAAPIQPQMYGGMPNQPVPYGMMPGIAGAHMMQPHDDESSSFMPQMPLMPNMPLAQANQPLSPNVMGMQDAQLPLAPNVMGMQDAQLPHMQPSYVAPAMHGDPCYPTQMAPMHDPCYPGAMPMYGAQQPMGYPAGMMPQVQGMMDQAPMPYGGNLPPAMPQVQGMMDHAQLPHGANMPHMMPQVQGAMDFPEAANVPYQMPLAPTQPLPAVQGVQSDCGCGSQMIPGMTYGPNPYGAVPPVYTPPYAQPFQQPYMSPYGHGPMAGGYGVPRENESDENDD